MSVNYPLYQVQPLNWNYNGSTSSGYLILIQVSNTALWQPAINILNLVDYAGNKLVLQAANNLPAYPMAYVIGTGTGDWSTDAAAKTAALADWTTITTARDQALAIKGFTQLPNPYVTLGPAVAGPG